MMTKDEMLHEIFLLRVAEFMPNSSTGQAWKAFRAEFESIPLASSCSLHDLLAAWDCFVLGWHLGRES